MLQCLGKDNFVVSIEHNAVTVCFFFVDEDDSLTLSAVAFSEVICCCVH